MVMNTLTIADETANGNSVREIQVEFENEVTTVKDIIEARVRMEVENYNGQLSEYFNGLVQPSVSEETLNGYKMKTRKKIDPEKQVYIALEAFSKNGFFILVDNLQVESLDREVPIEKDTRISFVKLTPLVGG